MNSWHSQIRSAKLIYGSLESKYRGKDHIFLFLILMYLMSFVIRILQVEKMVITFNCMNIGLTWNFVFYKKWNKEKTYNYL